MEWYPDDCGGGGSGPDGAPGTGAPPGASPAAAPPPHSQPPAPGPSPPKSLVALVGKAEKAAAALAAGSMHHGDSFGVYMQHKNLKLREQFEAQALGQAQISDVFRGVTIHVNGFTVGAGGGGAWGVLGGGQQAFRPPWSGTPAPAPAGPNLPPPPPPHRHAHPKGALPRGAQADHGAARRQL
jgi:hypothetical protein